MAILVNGATKLCVAGITGREGTFHTLRNRDYGTEAVAERLANTAMIFVPPRFAADSILEAEDAGIDLIIAITEGIPAHDELRVYNHLRRGRSRLIGPNCPGILSPGKANVGAIVSGSKGTAAAKAEVLESRGVRVGRNPTEVSEIAVEILGERV